MAGKELKLLNLRSKFLSDGIVDVLNLSASVIMFSLKDSLSIDCKCIAGRAFILFSLMFKILRASRC